MMTCPCKTQYATTQLIILSHPIARWFPSPLTLRHRLLVCSSKMLPSVIQNRHTTIAYTLALKNVKTKPVFLSNDRNESRIRVVGCPAISAIKLETFTIRTRASLPMFLTVFMFVSSFAYSWRTSCSSGENWGGGELCEVESDIAEVIVRLARSSVRVDCSISRDSIGHELLDALTKAVSWERLTRGAPIKSSIRRLGSARSAFPGQYFVSAAIGIRRSA